MKKWLSRRSLRFKVLGLVLAVLALVWAVGAATSIFQTNRLIAQEQRRSADSVAYSLAFACELPLAVRDRTELSSLVTRFGRDKPVLFAVIYDEERRVMASCVHDPAAWDLYQRQGRKSDLLLVGERQVELSSREGGLGGEIGGEEFAPTPGAEPERFSRKTIGRVAVALSAEPMLQAQRDQIRTTLATVLPGMLLSGLAVFLAGTQWIKRLNTLVKASERIASGDYGHAVPAESGDEIGRLSRAYEQMRLAVRDRSNKLLQANAQLRQAQSDLVQAEKMSMLGQLSAGVGHEINTPTGAILNIATDTYQHVQRLAESGIGVGRLTPESQDWLRRKLPEILADHTVRSELTSRSERRALDKQLRQQGLRESHRLAEVIVACGLTEKVDGDLLSHLAQPPLLGVLESATALKAAADVSIASAKKITRIVRALQFYCRKEHDAQVEIDVNESIENSLVMLNNRLKHLVELKADLAEALPAVRCGPELAQVWTNLLNNACDSIEMAHPGSMGHIEIASRLAGEQVRVTVSNDGPAIPDELMQKIYEPFFTTKAMGKGTGLGLSICEGILRRSGGRMVARNEQGWVTFEVTIPASPTRPMPASPDGRTSKTAEPARPATGD